MCLRDLKASIKISEGFFDCTKLKCDMPKDYQTHSEMYSDYKSHNTYKGFICITPNCWVTFVSHLYPGRISDREIVEKSDFCSLVKPGDKYRAEDLMYMISWP